MEEGLFPLSRAAFSPDPMELEEERRLCYVGMTRAKEQLFLSWARMRTIFGYTTPNKASRFLECIPEHLLQETKPPAGRQDTWDSTAQETEKLAEKTDSSAYRSGDRLRHPRFGEGIVISADTDGSGRQTRITAAFPKFGVKKLSLEHAPLEKL
jgi:DNA helicase-2/ATP-dependent DNA helicase PcrA